jgi:hypothetical protein
MELKSSFTLQQLSWFQSAGCTVEGKHPLDVTDRINSGKLEVPED